jgi:hypothetical protein
MSKKTVYSESIVVIYVLLGYILLCCVATQPTQFITISRTVSTETRAYSTEHTNAPLNSTISAHTQPIPVIPTLSTANAKTQVRRKNYEVNLRCETLPLLSAARWRSTLRCAGSCAAP